MVFLESLIAAGQITVDGVEVHFDPNDAITQGLV
jgi:hypothetical protein